MPAKPAERGGPHLWTIEEAERLLSSLTGVLSARIVARPGGDVEEVHLLRTESVSPKQRELHTILPLLPFFATGNFHPLAQIAPVALLLGGRHDQCPRNLLRSSWDRLRGRIAGGIRHPMSILGKQDDRLLEYQIATMKDGLLEFALVKFRTPQGWSTFVATETHLRELSEAFLKSASVMVPDDL